MTKPTKQMSALRSNTHMSRATNVMESPEVSKRKIPNADDRSFDPMFITQQADEIFMGSGTPLPNFVDKNATPMGPAMLPPRAAPSSIRKAYVNDHMNSAMRSSGLGKSTDYDSFGQTGPSAFGNFGKSTFNQYNSALAAAGQSTALKSIIEGYGANSHISSGGAGLPRPNQSVLEARE